MAEIVNLRQARKARDRAAAELTAAGNRTRFGQTKAGRNKNARELSRQQRQLDGHALPRPPQDEE